MAESSDLLIETLALLHELKSELSVMMKQVEKVEKTVECFKPLTLSSQRQSGRDRSLRSRSPIPVSEDTRPERQIYHRRSSLPATQILS